MSRQVSSERFHAFLEASIKYFNWQTILSEAGITEVSDKGDQFLIACPLHTDWSPSMRLSKNTGMYHCFSCGASGTYTKFLWELSGKATPYAQFCEQIYKAHPAMQAELKFPSLYVTEKTLDPQFNTRRVFNSNSHLGGELPITALADKVRKIGDTWENLVLSLTLLQQGVKTDSVLAALQKRTVKIDAPTQRISLMDLFD